MDRRKRSRRLPCPGPEGGENPEAIEAEPTEGATVGKSRRRAVDRSTVRMVARSADREVEKAVKVTLSLSPRAAKRLKDHAYHQGLKPGEYVTTLILAHVPRWAASRPLDPIETPDTGEDRQTEAA